MFYNTGMQALALRDSIYINISCVSRIASLALVGKAALLLLHWVLLAVKCAVVTHIYTAWCLSRI
jgi:hypothetical protein